MSRLNVVIALVGLSVAAFPQDPADVLRNRAKETSAKIAEIVKDGPDASESSLQTLQKLVDELKAIRTELQALTGAAPIAKKPPAISGYLQAQYQNSDRIVGGSGPYDAFRIRRLRLVVDADPKDRWHLRGSLDASAGSNQQGFLLKEAWARYTVPSSRALSVTLGQQALPIGYEIERSSFDLEFPERTLASTTLFNGEFLPGAKISYDATKDVQIQAGIMNALTAQDPEQSDRAAGSGDELGIVGAVTYSRGSNRIRVSGFSSQRPSYRAANDAVLPEADRNFLAIDAQHRFNLIKPITIRAEAVTGKDRLPFATEEGPLTAWHAAATVDIDRHNALAVRYQQFDRNRDVDGDSVIGYGVAYMWKFDKDLRLTLSHEAFVDSSRAAVSQKRYAETVLRLSLRF